MQTAINFIAVSSVALGIAACGNAKDASKSNFSNAIQAYLDTQKGLCAAIPAKDFPFTVSSRDFFGSQKIKQADALVDAGLLTKRSTEVKSAFGNKVETATEYQVTAAGNKFFVANGANTVGEHGAFCTGKYTVVEVDNFTQPSDTMGVKLSRVTYRYKVDGADSWAKLEVMRTSYDNFAEQAQGDIPGKATVILTHDGWVHEHLFKGG
ncbi:hypothetical protein GCM10007242_41710 [Pigmentiphaga litoralis]|uniref:hypothetical protein n=1 Tax=Pigmentiphaga litoralis TaxID=516702 RepID=UPI0016785B1D|nr:hypothetical protein [Pigmentiphaga litoralis]GGX30663.1 hypothetical protein GCM10007242_41710 [Pigmentiphaga litoralis]